VPERPPRDAYVTATNCPVFASALNGRADQQYCSPTCLQTAYRYRTHLCEPAPSAPAALPKGRSRREHTVYECGACEKRLVGEQWCPDCQRPARRIGPGSECPSCGDPIAISDLTEPPMT